MPTDNPKPFKMAPMASPASVLPGGRALKITPYDPPLRWLVPSEEIPGMAYLVDLSERDVCPHGICGCHDFDIRIWCPLLAGEEVERVDCKHIRKLVRYLSAKIKRKTLASRKIRVDNGKSLGTLK